MIEIYDLEHKSLWKGFWRVFFTFSTMRKYGDDEMLLHKNSRLELFFKED